MFPQKADSCAPATSSTGPMPRRRPRCQAKPNSLSQYDSKVTSKLGMPGYCTLISHKDSRHACTEICQYFIFVRASPIREILDSNPISKQNHFIPRFHIVFACVHHELIHKDTA